jgi:beta-glucanase (GH16 family)
MMLTGAIFVLAAGAGGPAARAYPAEWEIPAGGAPAPASPPTPTQTPPGFFDDFAGPAGSAPNAAYWAVVTGHGWGGQQNFTNGSVYLDGDSHLVLEAVNKNGSWTSGRVQTAVPVEPANNQASSANLLTFGYGTLSARVQIPDGMGAGLWPAFWLLGANAAQGVTWPSCGEIDVFEFTGSGTTVHTTIHGPLADNSTRDFQAQFKTATPDLSTAFHTYWMIHAENSVTFGVDSTTWGTFTPSSVIAGGEWVLNQPFYLIFDLAVGYPGSWAGPPDASTPSPAIMLVDWVKWEPEPA